MSADRILEIGYGFASAKALAAAVELGVFATLADGPLTLDALAARHGVHPRAASDLFDALVSLDLLERRDDAYANTPETDRYLDPAKPTYVGGLLAHANRAHYPLWLQLGAGLSTGEPQLQRGDTEDVLFDFYEDPEQLVRFLDGMSAWNAPTAKALAGAFPFDRYATVADIGCVAGNQLCDLLSAHPGLRGIGFDLPQTERHFRAYTQARGLGDRVAFAGGDFFADPLPAADVVVFSHVLHDWSVDLRAQLLRKAFDALPAGGAVVVVDAIVDDERRTATLPMLLSLTMLLATPGGGEYTAADCRGWMRDAGFGQTRVEPLAGLDSMVVGLK